MTKLPRSVVAIGDLHIPYQHPDAFEFLAYLVERYRTEYALSVGDLTDKHQTSYHAKELESYSAGDEVRKSARLLRQLLKLFPQLDVAEGNHDDLTKRKAKDVGIPKEFLRTPNETYGLPETWRFKPSFLYDLGNGNRLAMRHSYGTGILANVKKNGGGCTIQGHHHNTAGVEYYRDPFNIRWSASTGCLIDNSHPIFSYNKTNANEPILSSIVILDGEPILIPMHTDKRGRWVGRKKQANKQT